MSEKSSREEDASASRAPLHSACDREGLVQECELLIRENRKARRKADRMFSLIPCQDPSRGPNLREVMNYYGEKNKMLHEVRRKPKPASAFNAGAYENAAEDITDLPACYRSGSKHSALDELRDNPDLVDEVRRRAASNIGVSPNQVQYIHHRASTKVAANDKEEDTTNSVARLPDEIKSPNLSHTCAFCGFSGTRYRCSRCQSVSYCSVACQRRHWKASHHMSCSKV